jgi:hypothetical protein
MATLSFFIIFSPLSLIGIQRPADKKVNGSKRREIEHERLRPSVPEDGLTAKLARVQPVVSSNLS